MRKTLVAFVLALGLASFAAAQVPIGVSVTPFKVQPVSAVTTAKDTSIAMVIKYFPPRGGSATALTPTVAVAATSLTFTVGGAAYTGFELPVSGALGGVITMSDASADTMGEVVDAINSTPDTFTTGFFRAAIVNGLRSDVLSTLAFTADGADTDVGRPDLGEIIYWDSDVLYDDEVGLFDVSKGASAFIGPKGLAKNPHEGITTQVQQAYSLITNAGTVGDATVYAVKRNYVTGGGCNAAGDCGSGSEVVRTVVIMPLATTVAASGVAYLPQGFIAKDEYVFLRNDSTGAVSTVLNLNISGFQYPNQ